VGTPEVSIRKNRRSWYFKLKTSGTLFLTGMFCVLVAAWNTGDNMLYLIVGMMVSLIVVSVAFSRITLSRLSVEQMFPPTIHEGEAAELITRVRNNKRLFHSFSLQIDAEQRNGDSTGYVLRVAPGDNTATVMRRTFKRRGLHLLSPTRVSTSYPFGLFEQCVMYGGDTQVLVYPEVKRLEESAVERMLGRGELMSRGGRGPGTEYYSLREYFHGDDARLISWKVSAKQGKLMLRELEKPERKALLLGLDTDADPGQLFEEAVKFCASLASRCVNDGYDVELIMPEESTGRGSGQQHLHKILRCLALVEPTRAKQEQFLSQLYRLRQPEKGTVSVIVTPDRTRLAGYFRAARVSVVQFDHIKLD
jgi:uncharacterized protein (DUF58 family)